MKLKDIRESIIKGFIAKELIDNSVYPTLELICRNLMRDFGNINIGSSLLKERHRIAEGEPASISKFNKIQKFIDIDIHTLYRFIDYMEGHLDGLFRDANNRLNSIVRASKNLTARANALLIADSSGFQDTTVRVEHFKNSKNINTEETDAHINYAEQRATSKTIKGNVLKTIHNKVKEVIVSPLTKGYLSFAAVPNRGELNMFTSSSIPWIHKMLMPSSYKGKTTLSVKIKLNENIEISRLKFNFLDKTPYYISVTANINNRFITVSKENEYIETADIGFSPIETSYIILNISTTQPYGEEIVPLKGTIFRFCIKEFKIALHEYAEVSQIVLKEYTPKNKFSQVALSANQVLPKETSIDYFISTDKETYRPISLLEDRNSKYGKIINIFDTTTLCSEKTSVDLNKKDPYIYEHLFGTYYSEPNIDSIMYYNPRIIRNLNQMDYSKAKDHVVRSTIYVKKDCTIDFEKYNMNIDSTFRNTKGILSKGIHECKINSSQINPRKIESLFSEEEIEYGTHLSSYVPKEKYALMINKNNAFTFIEKNNGFIAVINSPKDNVKEKMIVIKRDLDTEKLKTTVKVKAVLHANLYESPILKELIIKTL